jgi:peroxiredoxin
LGFLLLKLAVNTRIPSSNYNPSAGLKSYIALKLQMKKIVYLCLSVVLGVACNEQPKSQKESANSAFSEKLNGTPVMTAAAIAKDFDSFWTYYSRYAQLCQDYPTQDENGRTIARTIFLEKLNTGLYLPLVIYGKPQMIFKLAKIPPHAPKDISLLLSNYANKELTYAKMEGKPIPSFSFKDLNGKRYTSANTKGKIVLFKCWFIHCQACIEEMPALNELVARYKNRNDILYLSLAIDQPTELSKFLAKTKFNYQTIPMQEAYMTNQLHIQAYPTHYLINKAGILVKVLDEEKVMEQYLEKELAR